MFCFACLGRVSLPFTTGLILVWPDMLSHHSLPIHTTDLGSEKSYVEMKRKSGERDNVQRIMRWEVKKREGGGGGDRKGKGQRERRRLGHFLCRRPCLQRGSEYCQHLSVQKPRVGESGRESRGGNWGKDKAPLAHFSIQEKRRFAVCKNSAVDSSIFF